MRFKADENLPLEIAELLRQQGHDALSACSKSLWGRFPTGRASCFSAARPVENRPHKLLEQTLSACSKSGVSKASGAASARRCRSTGGLTPRRSPRFFHSLSAFILAGRWACRQGFRFGGAIRRCPRWDLNPRSPL